MQPQAIYILFLAVRDVVNLLHRHRVQFEWRQLGVQLNIKKTELNHIKRNNEEDPGDCLTEMITSWINTGKATWTALAEALENISAREAAEEGEKVQYITGCIIVNSFYSNHPWDQIKWSD